MARYLSVQQVLRDMPRLVSQRYQVLGTHEMTESAANHARTVSDYRLVEWTTTESRDIPAMSYKKYLIGNIRTWETTNFTVTVDAYEEDDLDLSFDDDGRVARDLDNGRLIAFRVAARVIHKPTGIELGADHLGGCIYESLEAFADHIACGRQNRRTIRREGKFQIIRKARPYPSCISKSDRLKKRGFATRELAEAWAATNAKEPFEIYPTGTCGSYFSDMVSSCIAEARKNYASMIGSLAATRLRDKSGANHAS